MNVKTLEIILLKSSLSMVDVVPIDVRERIGEKKICYPLENITFSFATSCMIILSDPLMKRASIYCFQSLRPVNITGHRVFCFEHGRVSKSQTCIPKDQQAFSQKKKTSILSPNSIFFPMFSLAISLNKCG